nr:CatB-related O-acetyltransferase [Ancylobacter sp. Lp-2]
MRGDAPEILKVTPGAKGVTVGNDVWIGQRVLLRRGITIGDGAVIGAGSVVVKDVPPFAIIGGAPARIIRFRFDEETIARIQRVKWWDYAPEHFAGMDLSDPRAFLDSLEERIAGGLEPYKPQPFNLAKVFSKLAGAAARTPPAAPPGWSRDAAE